MRRGLGLLGLIAVLLSACSDSRSAPAPTTTPSTPPTTTALADVPRLASFSLGQIDLQSVSGDSVLPDGVRSALHTTLDRYLVDGVVNPLRSGLPTGDLSQIFAEPALGRLSGEDRRALLDENLPRADHVLLGTATASLSMLLGTTGDVGLALADIRVTLTAELGGVPLSIERTGQLMLAPDGENWKINGYDIKVTRTTAETTTTLETTTTAGVTKQ